MAGPFRAHHVRLTSICIACAERARMIVAISTAQIASATMMAVRAGRFIFVVLILSEISVRHRSEHGAIPRYCRSFASRRTLARCDSDRIALAGENSPLLSRVGPETCYFAPSLPSAAEVMTKRLPV